MVHVSGLEVYDLSRYHNVAFNRAHLLEPLNSQTLVHEIHVCKKEIQFRLTPWQAATAVQLNLF